MIITAAHYKAARQLLGWGQSRLAGEAGVSTTTVADIERGARVAESPLASQIRRALEAAGVEFTPGGECGVKLIEAK